jgi:hypothetical protein
LRGAFVVSEEAGMAAPTPIGRPRKADTIARRDEFLRLVFEGVPLKEAARRARIKPERALDILTPLVSPVLAKVA